MKRTTLYTIGIDEVGRGPLAGPVAVGAFVFLKPEARRLFRGVKESKQLSEPRREEWFARILAAKREGLVDYRVAFRSEKDIDDPHRGLAWAIRSALAATLKGLVDARGVTPEDALILLDGGLKAPLSFQHQKTIIKGDEKETVIALASICAKVLRDRRMRVLARKYPHHGFDVHKGYGTRAHYASIKKYGVTEAHRKSFL